MAFLTPLASLATDIYSFRDESGTMHYTNVPPLNQSKFRRSFTKMRTKEKRAIPQRSGNTLAGGQDYTEVIFSACEQFAVDSQLVRAVIKAESNFNPEAVSRKGAMGLMQLMPDTAREMGVSNPFDPEENIRGGVMYLSQLLYNLRGDVPLALAAYNAGPQRVTSYNGIPPFRETRNYVEKVLSYYQLFNNDDQL
jgi:soluble lytic murein transglycosylase-like protein